MNQNAGSINHSVISLMKQQCKAEWIGFGDECSRLFMARIKQRKAMASIYFIKGHDDQRFEGFEVVSRVLTDYYKDLYLRLPITASRLSKGECRQVNVQMTGVDDFVNSLTKLKMSRRIRALFYAMVNAVIYNIWLARNRKLFYSKAYPVEDMLKEIKRQVTLRVLHLHQYRQNYTSCLDFLLHKV
ncbi:hypothetical protein Cgig2_029039 [Carnegiea gigantea]|uniref:Uncharacterized protein n=1 Tax=Carnegiea gigantea TaxID=171969 RepID=A0A9Q1KB95_9CARY|nr:hypothetical protein Cgig2_029039 [Carnegiea gigantea]